MKVLLHRVLPLSRRQVRVAKQQWYEVKWVPLPYLL
jgi:hypothetical protein